MSDAIDATCQGCGDPVGPGDLQLSHGRWIHHLCYMSDEELTAHQQAEIEALRAKLADCQAVIRHKGHDVDCPKMLCGRCGYGAYGHWERFPPHVMEESSDPCSDTCGHDRTTGEKT